MELAAGIDSCSAANRVEESAEAESAVPMESFVAWVTLVITEFELGFMGAK